MKRLLLIISLFLFVISCSKDSGTSPNDEPLPVPDLANYYKLDIKTPIGDKYNAQGLKAGLNTYVEKFSGWCEKEEFGEDYSIWIEDISRKNVEGDRWYVSFKLSIEVPSAIFRGDVFRSERLKLYYDIPDDMEGFEDATDKALIFLNKSLELTHALGTLDPKIKVFAITGDKAVEFMKFAIQFFSDPEIREARKAEALFCGQAIGETLKLWFYEYEQSGW